MKRLRLVKIVMQAVFVIDDGETLEEALGPQSTVMAADLDALPGALREFMAKEELAMNAASATNGDKPAPNRAARRAKSAEVTIYEGAAAGDLVREENRAARRAKKPS